MRKDIGVVSYLPLLQASYFPLFRGRFFHKYVFWNQGSIISPQKFLDFVFRVHNTHFPIRAFLLGICSLWKPQNELIDKIWTASHKRKAKEKSQRSSNWPNKHSCTNNQNFFFNYSCVGWSIDNKFDAPVADSFGPFRREHWWFIKQSIFRFQAFA